jgi:hypothetical protein
MRLSQMRVLRGIGLRHVRPDGIEHRCYQCNGRLPLFTRRSTVTGEAYCPICDRSALWK